VAKKNPGFQKFTAFKPTVSIIVPARNEENVLGRLLKRLTVLAYPKNKLQVIVVNDGSSDKTREIADHYASKYKGLIKTVHREIGGLGKSYALNDGLQYAKGEIIGFFDADYVPQRDILKKTVPYFLNPDIGAVQARIFVLNRRQS
jgi:cellulose synthase/poly-beta-1,6-N-acetylglucosamine synthase-like glycosyltransferase